LVLISTGKRREKVVVTVYPAKLTNSDSSSAPSSFFQIISAEPTVYLPSGALTSNGAASQENVFSSKGFDVMAASKIH
jgi:hypothetical protein